MSIYDQQLCDWISRQTSKKVGPLMVGICGAQGSGKSTLARHLATGLQQKGLHVAILSLDDLYLTRAQRQQLARDVHPLLATRGVPGTHDIPLGLELFERLRQQLTTILRLPRFDKSQDERCPIDHWPALEQLPDVLLFEGWCVAVPPQTTAALATPINQLEAEQDADGRWRHWVNQQLATQYPQLFDQLDRLIYLQIPDWSAVLNWRSQQERDTAGQSASRGLHLMNDAQLAQFIQHYERLTRHALQVMPQRADVVRVLGMQHDVQDQVITADRHCV